MKEQPKGVVGDTTRCRESGREGSGSAEAARGELSCRLSSSEDGNLHQCNGRTLGWGLSVTLLLLTKGIPYSVQVLRG